MHVFLSMPVINSSVSDPTCQQTFGFMLL